MTLHPDMYITASCTISNHVVYKNSRPLFEHKGGDVAGFLLAVYRHFEMQYPKFYKMDNLSKLGWLAVELLLAAGFNASAYKPEDTGIVLANASASLDTDIKYYDTIKNIASPALFVYTLPNIVIGEICIRHGFKGENAFFISEKFDAGFIEQYVANLINNSILQCCICGWVDILNEQYKATLFLVEKTPAENSDGFTKENLNKIYQLQNG
jgi:hypothetical protein